MAVRRSDYSLMIDLPSMATFVTVSAVSDSQAISFAREYRSSHSAGTAYLFHGSAIMARF